MKIYTDDNKFLGFLTGVEKAGNFCGFDSTEIESKLIESILGRNTIVIKSSATKVHSFNSSIFSSNLWSSVVLDSTLLEAFVDESKIEGCRIVQGLVGSSVLTNSNIYGKVKFCVGEGLVVEDEAYIYGVKFSYQGCYIKSGFWEREPKKIEFLDSPYDVVESVEDKVLIGCFERSVPHWLRLSEKAASKIGINPEYHKKYIEAIIEIADYKTTNPSPRREQ